MLNLEEKDKQIDINYLKNKLKEIDKRFYEDPNLLKKAEEYRKKYGTLTAKDLMKIIYD